MTDDELRAAIIAMRKVAQPVGTLHGWWDTIFDCEALLKGGKTLVPRDQIEASVRDCLRRIDEKKMIIELSV